MSKSGQRHASFGHPSLNLGSRFVRSSIQRQFLDKGRQEVNANGQEELAQVFQLAVAEKYGE